MSVEQREVRLRVQERLVLVLTVEINELFTQLVQCTDRGKRVVDERPAATLRGDLAAEDDLAPLSGF